MNRRVAGVLAVSAVGALAFATPGLAGSEFKNKYQSGQQERNCGDGDTVVYRGPAKLWPPNHKFQPADVIATDGPSTKPNDELSDQTELALRDGVLDAVGGDGGANHDPDVNYPNGPVDNGNPSAIVDLELRSERSGRGEGRTYSIHWIAEFDTVGPTNKTCTSADSGQSPFTVTVPHDMSGGADWK